LAFLSHPNKRRNGRSERKQKALSGLATDGGEFGRSGCVEWRSMLAMAAAAGIPGDGS